MLSGTQINYSVWTDEFWPMSGTSYTSLGGTTWYKYVRNISTSFGGRYLTEFGHILRLYRLVTVFFARFRANARQKKSRHIFHTNMWDIFRTVLVEGIWPNSGIFLGYTHLSWYSLPDFGQTPGKRNQGTYFTQICEKHFEQFWWKVFDRIRAYS